MSEKEKNKDKKLQTSLPCTSASLVRESVTNASNSSANFIGYDYMFANDYSDNQFQSSYYQRTSYRSLRYRPPKHYIPMDRNWKYTEYGKLVEETKDSKTSNQNLKSRRENLQNKPTFKLATYNLLSPDLLDDNFYLYKHINFKYLDWNYRKYKLYQEIKRLKSDIYCFQEMHEDEFYEYFLPKLSQLGYKCFYKKRYGPIKKDGCAICFKAKKFELIKEEQVDYFIPNVDVLNKENVGLILFLRCKTSNSRVPYYLCVATTHILFSPKRGDIKLAQLQVLLSHLDKIAFKSSIKIGDTIFPTYHPTVICGDFNLVDDSKLYEFLSSSMLANYRDLNRNTLSGQIKCNRSSILIETNLLPNDLGISDQSQFKSEVDKRVKSMNEKTKSNLKAYCSFGRDHLQHFFNFKSVYKHYTEEGHHEVTTCVNNCKDTVDYIFYHTNNRDFMKDFDLPVFPDGNKSKRHKEDTYDNEFDDEEEEEEDGECLSEDESKEQDPELELLARLELFDEETLENVDMPEKNYASDHFLLAAKFTID